MKHSIGTPCWVDLSTPDPAAAQDFYRALFGWTFDIQPEQYGGYAMCKRTGDAVVAGIGRAQNPDVPTAWTVYLAVSDLAEAASDWQARGGRIVTAPMEIPEQGHMAIVADPTGAVVGLWQPLGHGGFDQIGPPGAPCWFEVATRESETARDFFAAQFDLTAQKMEGMNYFTLHDAERPRYGVLQMTEEWAGLPPHWMVYFTVEEIEKATKTVAANGGTVQHGPFDTPQGPVAVCSDPSGAVFSLIHPSGA